MMGKVCDWSGVAMWERCVSGARWQGGKGVLIASTKSRSLRGASHQPAFMSGCLTICHTCLPRLPSERMLPY